MSDEKIPAIDNLILIATNQHMLDFSKQVQIFYDQAISFLNRCDDSNYYSKIKWTEEGYDRGFASFPESLFDYWYSPQKNKSFKSVEDLIVKTMIDSLKLEDSATVFPGKITVLGSGLYAAWIEGDLRNYYIAHASEKSEMVNGSPADFGTIYNERTQNSEL